MIPTDSIILFSIGFGISTISLVVGSMTPIYLVLMQFFFPTLTLGNVLGADKMSGVFRGIGAIPSFWKKIDWSFIMQNIPAFLIGSVLGVNIIAEIPKYWIFPLLIMAFFVAEFSPYLSKYMTGKKFILLEGFLGMYAGILGAAIKPTLLSVFRLKIPDDEKIIFLKIQIQTIMFFVVISASITHFFHGNLLPHIIIPLALGNLLGGFLGGKFLQKMGKLSGNIQKNIMRLSFIIGIISSGIMIF